MSSPATTYAPNNLPYIKPKTITLPTVYMDVGEALMGIQQIITSAGNANGTAPVGTPTVANGLVKYATATTGGLFDFGSLDALCVFFECDFGASTAYTVTVSNMNDAGTATLAGEDTQVAAATSRFYVTTEPFRLTSRQVIKISTTAGSAAMVLRVKAVLQRNYQG